MCYLISAYIKNIKKEDIKKTSLPFSLCSIGELNNNEKNLLKRFGLDFNYMSINYC